MDRNRRNKRHSNWNKQKNNNNNSSNNQERENPVDRGKKKFQFQHTTNYDDERAKKEKAIMELKAREVICPVCSQPITDIASALSDKATGNPVHFDCVLEDVSKKEKLEPNERIAYIGKGRFGVLYYENPNDQKHFTIKRIIEWENREQKSQWRDELSEIYSKVN